MTIQVRYDLPYEGTNIFDFDTVSEAVDFIISLHISFDDVDMYEVGDSYDVYTLVKQRLENKND